MTSTSRRLLLRAFMTALAAAALAWIAGGQALLGRVDPALAIPVLMLPMLILAWRQREEVGAVRFRAPFLVLVFLAIVQALLAIALAGTIPWLQLLLAALAGGAAALVADTLFRWRAGHGFLPWLAALVLVVGWFGAGHVWLSALYRPSAAPAGSPAVTMLTGLPLRWSGGGDITAIIAGGVRDDLALVRLESTGPVSLVDSLVDQVPPPGGALFVAHPRALAPRELVAIDAFVRGGGRVVVLADALSGWPARYPLGDPRNPPVTSLLAPLLDHWGITLDAAPVAEIAALPVDVDGARLRLFSAGRFDGLPPQCLAYAGRRIARCRIGKGDAWLVGDADLLFYPLWRPLVPGAAHLRQADTMEWLSARLWRGSGQGWLGPVWIRIRTT